MDGHENKQFSFFFSFSLTVLKLNNFAPKVEHAVPNVANCVCVCACVIQNTVLQRNRLDTKCFNLRIRVKVVIICVARLVSLKTIKTLKVCRKYFAHCSSEIVFLKSKCKHISNDRTFFARPAIISLNHFIFLFI